ncbi:hypothetical protein ACYZX9_12730 [Sphingomonas citri]|uniref:Uncharacterized protein n=1 Tax=Sphingomonas citri TaxID=2862499 RepID=A0ABS7BP45_9SPHN|nr:hypothetical protein [Sphingomonas citri]MBW6531389.1 hypothetical protein [Sphingomonas citri]
MTRYDPRAVVRAPEFDLFPPDGQRAPARAESQGCEHDPCGPEARRSPEHGRVGIDPASAALGKHERLLALRAAARGRAIRAALAAAPLHRARLLRAMVAAHRRAA